MTPSRLRTRAYFQGEEELRPRNKSFGRVTIFIVLCLFPLLLRAVGEGRRGRRYTILLTRVGNCLNF
jgi:hypothetical protein